MGNLLRRLEAKPKMFRTRAIPATHRFAVGDSVESIVNLGGGEAFRVELQHLRRRKLLRIKSPSPRGILESGGADQRNHDEKIQKASYRIQIVRSPFAVHRSPFDVWGARRSRCHPLRSVPPSSVKFYRIASGLSLSLHLPFSDHAGGRQRECRTEFLSFDTNERRTPTAPSKR